MSTHQSVTHYNRRRMKTAAAAASTSSCSTSSGSGAKNDNSISNSNSNPCLNIKVNSIHNVIEKNISNTEKKYRTNTSETLTMTTNKKTTANIEMSNTSNTTTITIMNQSISKITSTTTTAITTTTTAVATMTTATTTTTTILPFNSSIPFSASTLASIITDTTDSVNSFLSHQLYNRQTNELKHSQNNRQISSIVMSPLRSPYNRTRSKSYGGQKGAPDTPDLHNNNNNNNSSNNNKNNNDNNNNNNNNVSDSRNNASSITNFSFGSFGMPQNFSQVLPNLNSLPEYFNSVSIPNMPNITIPTITMPTLPNLPNLSMPNISMPSIPSIPNLNIPSISEIMSFPGRKNSKSWSQICQLVKESRERYAEVCPSIPFCFHFRYNDMTGILRIYFLASVKSETTLYYCDVQPEGTNGRDMRPIFEIDEEMLLDSDMEHDNNHSQNLASIKILHQRMSDYSFEHAPKVPKRSNNLINSSSSSSSSSMDDDEVHETVRSIDDIRTSTQLLRPPPVASPTSSVPDCEDLQWQPLLARQTTFNRNIDEDETAISDFTFKNQELSREEDLILERKRMPFTGLISYDFHQDAARFVYTIKNMIYWFDDIEILNKVPQSPRYVPQKLMTNPHPKMSATICPHDPDFVAYIADNDLWVCNLISGDDIRLTNMSKMKGLSAGQPSFVMQEEFNRFDGYWWRPSNVNKSNDDSCFTILCEFLDEQNVPITAIANCDGTAELHYFPKPGGLNAISSLGLVNFTYNTISPSKNLAFSTSRHWSVQVNRLDFLQDIFPEFEYLINCNWLNSDVISVQLLNRQQTKIVLGIISVSSSFPAQVLFEESVNDGWYNCHNLFYVYERNNITKPNDIINFLWSSEESGFRHLYKITVRIQPFPIRDKYFGEKSDSKEAHEEVFSLREKNPIKTELINSQQITSGSWEVLSEQIWVDESRDLIYFLGNKQSPLECHLYCVSSKFTPRSMPRRVTQEDYTHSNIHFDPHYNYCIDFQSNLSKPPFSVLHRILASENSAHMITLEPLYHFLSPPNDMTFGDSNEFYDKVQSLGPSPQLFECKLDTGELIYGFFFKPDIVEPGVKYPVLLEIYGGPEIQVVSKSFKDVRQHKRHLLASEGYVVVGFDSRGSKNRGTEFERHIHRRLGQVEINDQVQVLQWLAEKIGIIDMSRVAIHGWSYGGYLSLMALVQRPDIFKCCIAGAPVTNWMLYDTAYTERYMGLPEDNVVGYQVSSVLSHVRNFPDEQNRLLIIHGLMDENVHFSHTSQLINALVKAGKPYNLNIFPYERHCLRKGYCSEHYEATLLYFLQQNL